MFFYGATPRATWRAEQARAAALRTGLQEVLQRVVQSFGPKPEGKTLGGETVQGPGAEMRRGKESARLEPNGQRGRMSRRGPGEIGAPAGTRVPNTEASYGLGPQNLALAEGVGELLGHCGRGGSGAEGDNLSDGDEDLLHWYVSDLLAASG